MQHKIVQSENKTSRNICFCLEILLSDPSRFFASPVTLSVPIQMEIFEGKLTSGIFCTSKTKL